MKKFLIPIIITLVVGAAAAAAIYGRQSKLQYRFVRVERGGVIQSVSVVGHVVPSDELTLSFLRSGTILRLRVEVGQAVTSSTPLVELSTESLRIDKAGSEARLRLAQAKLAQSKAGSPEEKIKVAETTVTNAELSGEKAAAQKDLSQIAVINAQKSLENVKAKASDDLSKVVADSFQIAKTALTALDKAVRTFDSIKDKYFYSTTQLSLQVKDSQSAMENAYSPAKAALDAAAPNPNQDKVKTVLAVLSSALSQGRDSLTALRAAMDDASVTTSATDRSSVDSERTSIDSQLAYVTDASGDIVNQEITNTKAIDSAEADLKSAQADLKVAESAVKLSSGELKKAKDELAVTKSGPRAVDLALFYAEIDEAVSSIARINKDIEDSVILSPIDGVITATSKKAGERAAAGETAIKMISQDSRQLEADVSELDIAKVTVGESARLTFDAFGPDRVLSGRVTKIDPKEKLKEGDVYYTVTVELEGALEDIRPGLTADISIETARRDNVLYLPRRAVTSDGKKSTVKSLQQGRERAIEVVTGLAGKDTIEIISGLAEGQEVILSVRSP